MKNFIKILAVFALFFGFSSCDELDELTEVDFDTTVSDVITVNVNGGEAVPLNSFVNVNIANPDTQDYLDKIEKVKINSMTYKVISFLGDNAGVITADLKADSVTLDTHTGVTVSNEMGVIYTITDTAQLSTIANKLKNAQDVVFAVVGTGTSNEDGMTFNIEITLELEVTADAL